MQVWHGLVIATVSLLLQTCLFAVISYLFSRHRANECERILKAAKPPAPEPSPADHHSPVAKETKGPLWESSAPASKPCYRHYSDTSSDSSDSSDSAPSTCQAPKDLNYTQVVFSASGGLKSESVRDYQNLNETTDYVNINPESHKTNVWSFVNHASEPVEYTQVAL
ncbi:PREDICTED: uncharacterized protein C1orf186 homolog [Chrysochloris asiatica]|uniref:Uncharacterized protein C1orf186 homolog n=1 Tax=Chrysochloris asiatica TaxID=185453 RepID=A0A9B0WGP6_CHRAS|nr:PREDICTED: uncharacterized protein C1orf186 homolog [Chrysochloris asiatica]